MNYEISLKKYKGGIFLWLVLWYLGVYLSSHIKIIRFPYPLVSCCAADTGVNLRVLRSSCPEPNYFGDMNVRERKGSNKNVNLKTPLSHTGPQIFVEYIPPEDEAHLTTSYLMEEKPTLTSLFSGSSASVFNTWQLSCQHSLEPLWVSCMICNPMSGTLVRV